MFNLDNFDLDIDDDFSSNIFSNAINSQGKNAVEKENSKCSNQTNSNYKLNVSSNQQVCGQTIHTRISSKPTSDSPLLKEPKENVLKRPCTHYDEPQKKRLSSELLQRKFPGPAGLLPDKPFKEISSVPMENPGDGTEDDNRDFEKPIVYSQCSGSVFQESSYQKLLSDFNLTETKNTLNRYTVEWLKKTALSKGLQGRKVPFLGLVVHSVNHTTPDPIVILRDPTGEIRGSLHREVWADMGGKLRAGIALALRQVGVLITGVIRRQVYLNITMNNILALYSPSENENQVEITTVNQISKLDLLKNVEQWLPQPARNAGTKSSSSSVLFATVNDVRPSPTNRPDNKSTDRSKSGSVGGGRDAKEVLADLGIVLTDADFNEEMEMSFTGPVCGSSEGGLREANGASFARGESGPGLSEAESQIFQEVLSGIDLDEFEFET